MDVADQLASTLKHLLLEDRDAMLKERTDTVRAVRTRLASETSRLREMTGKAISSIGEDDGEVRSILASMQCMYVHLADDVLQAAYKGDTLHSQDSSVGVNSDDSLLSSNEARADEQDAVFSQLTSREQELADLVVAGKTNREIAEILVLSEFTVKNHLRSIFQKLQIRSRSQLAALGAHRKAIAIDFPFEDWIDSNER